MELKCPIEAKSPLEGFNSRFKEPEEKKNQQIWRAVNWDYPGCVRGGKKNEEKHTENKRNCETIIKVPTYTQAFEEWKGQKEYVK